MKILFLFFAGGSVCIEGCLCLRKEQVGLIKKFRLDMQDNSNSCTLSTLLPLYFLLSHFSLRVPSCYKNNLAEANPWYFCCVRINRTTKHVQHAGLLQPCCTRRANCGCFLSADMASLSLSVINYCSLGTLSYSFRKGTLMSCTSWKTRS